MADQQRLEDFLEQKEYCFDALLVEFRWLEELEDVMQDSTWHREGNVLEHTRRVCRAVVSGEEWKDLNREERAVLYMAAMFHDIDALCRRRGQNHFPRAQHCGDEAVSGAVL